MGPEIALAATAISAGVGAVGAIQQGQASADAANYQAGVARNNAIIAGQNKQYAVQAGAVKAQAQDLRNRETQGRVLAAQGASGIDTDSTTSTEVRQSAAEIGRLDTMTIMANALLTSRAAGVAESDAQAQATLATQRAAQSETAGLIGAGSSILGGAASFADKWASYKAKGVEGF